MRSFFSIMLLTSFASNVFAGQITISGNKANELYNEMAEKQPREFETSESGISRTLGHRNEGLVITCNGETKKNAKDAICEVYIFDGKGKL